MDKIASYKELIYKEAGFKEDHWRPKKKIKEKKKKEPLIPKGQEAECIVPAIGGTVGMNVLGTLAANATGGATVPTLAGLGAGAYLGYKLPSDYLQNKRKNRENLENMRKEIESLKKQQEQRKE